MDPQQQDESDGQSSESTEIPSLSSYDDYNQIYDYLAYFKFIKALNSGLPEHLTLTASAAREEAQVLSKQIFACHNILKHTIERHEGLIQRRWAKRTYEQRKHTLQLLWEDIPTMHRPDLFLLRARGAQVKNMGPECRPSFIVPLLNLEDLCKVKLMFLLLSSRSRNPPGSFVKADLSMMHIGLITHAISPKVLNGYTMYLPGTDNAEAYGRISAWDESPRSFDDMANGFGIQPGEGLLILEAQEKIVMFLFSFMELILHDIDLSDVSTPTVFAPVTITEASTGIQSRADTVLEAPYRAPEGLNLRRLYAIIYAKRAEIQDHIWLLREDPSYFSEYILIAGDHRRENIPGITGKMHPVLHKPIFWDMVFDSMLVESYTGLLAWDAICRVFSQVAELKEMGSILVGNWPRYSGAYYDALGHLDCLVREMLRGPVDNLDLEFAAAPTLRQYFERMPGDETVRVPRVRLKPNGRGNKLIDLLERLSHRDLRFITGLRTVLSEIEIFLHNDPDSKNRISGLMATDIADIGILSELQHIVNLSTPCPKFMYTATQDEFKTTFWRNVEPVNKVFQVMSQRIPLSKLGIPLNQFYYPIDQPRTAITTREMRAAEKALDKFWDRVDDYIIETCKVPLHQLMDGVLERREIYRTPEWVEPKAKAAAKNVMPATFAEALALLNVDDQADRNISGSSIASFLGPSPVPSRIPSPGPSGANVDAPGAPAQPPPTFNEASRGPPRPTPDTPREPIMPVSKRAYKVFGTLFPSPNPKGEPGELVWADFQYAMSSVGFTMEKLDGSAWLFTPAQTSIWWMSMLIHEPCPAGKISSLAARRIGKRLGRAYGWTGESFTKV